MTDDPLAGDELERVRANAPVGYCGECGGEIRLELDGRHWYHEAGCPLAARIFRRRDQEE